MQVNLNVNSGNPVGSSVLLVTSDCTGRTTSMSVYLKAVPSNLDIYTDSKSNKTISLREQSDRS
jgi:hypothetical protein